MITRKMAEGVMSLLNLDTLEGLTKRKVELAYRAAAKAAHPDGGGSEALFVATDRAKALLLQWVAHPAPAASETPEYKREDCPVCHGEGRRTLRRGFNNMTMQCGTCHGTGDANYRPGKSNTDIET